MKTFREVIRDIKAGETWECGGFRINCFSNGDIEIESVASGNKFGFYDNDMFRIRRREYTFAEAFEAYEDGKEIESVDTNTCYFKYSDRLGEGDKHFLMGMREIRGKWYIND